MTKKIKRISRPIGSTFLSQQYNQKQDKESKDKLCSLVLNHYINNNLTINNKQVTLEQLASYLGITNIEITSRFYKEMGKYGNILSKDGYGTVLGVLANLGTKNLLEDRYRILQQVEVLERSQQGVYKPFMSTSLNQALGNLLGSSKAVMEWYKTLQPNKPIVAIQNNIVSDPGMKPSQFLSQIQALKLLEENGQGTFAYSEERHTKLLGTGILNGVPEVRANHQAIPDTDGMRITKPIQQSDKTTHEDRRSLEYGIDEEEDDQI